MNLSDKMSYLNGMVDGMELDLTTKEGKVLSQLLDVLQETVLYVTDLQDQVDELTELWTKTSATWKMQSLAMKRMMKTKQTSLKTMTMIMMTTTMICMKQYVRIVRIRLYCQILFWMKARCIVRAATNCWNLITAI